MKNKEINKVLLLILDGWGYGKKDNSDAIFNAETPYFDSLLEQYPNSELLTCCNHVGLPEGQMGNSEVGHLNIGAGRVVFQDLERINNAIKEDTLKENSQILKACDSAIKSGNALHFIGLLSDGGVHSMNAHLYELINIAEAKGLQKVFVHIITDGRDTDPHSGQKYIEELHEFLKGKSTKVASLIGRYYSMDRDKRWERIKEGYDLMVNGKGKSFENVIDAIKSSYKDGVTDEFIKASVIEEKGKPIATIQDGDTVIAYNFRTDRLREMTHVLSQEDMPEYDMHTLHLNYFTMTNYDKKFKNVNIIFDKEDLKNTLGEVISKNGLNQLRIAETEKYAHVTFFFSGGREEPFENENRIMVNSPKVATYDLQPEMSAYLVKDKLVSDLNEKNNDFIVVNFANGDMVGHTGIMSAILKAAKAVDNCISEVIETAKANNYTVLLTADHGNADFAVNGDGSPNTAHSLNPVPFILISDKLKNAKLNNGILADIAPTILKLMGVERSEEMTGKVLVEEA
ncbi:MAG: 2,3-bisphosphoglycerate-independent phosphoglycerate mutase [Marinilabiliales bacterium]|nr:MAG: 2,3-bisphosphoglycerate-independent phosphoglycerate mutase [Marinilabiliales bacterium]